jgi:hypothetical protein
LPQVICRCGIAPLAARIHELFRYGNSTPGNL